MFYFVLIMSFSFFKAWTITPPPPPYKLRTYQFSVNLIVAISDLNAEWIPSMFILHPISRVLKSWRIFMRSQERSAASGMRKLNCVSANFRAWTNIFNVILVYLFISYSFAIKGTVVCVKWPSMQRWQWPIYNGTLEALFL